MDRYKELQQSVFDKSKENRQLIKGLKELKDYFTKGELILQKENTSLKAQLSEANENNLILVQGYYNWIYLNKPSIDDILDRLEKDRKILLNQ